MHVRAIGAALKLIALLIGASSFLSAAQSAGKLQAPPVSRSEPQALHDEATARAELQTGAQLTANGFLQQAIPHLLAARAAGIAPYAAGVNLGICYLGTGRFKDAIDVLHALDASGRGSAAVENLLAQAYIGNAQPQEALRSFRRAAAATPKDEKLYDYIADACTDHKNYALGLQIVALGLQQLPNSARLHYEKALFLSQLGRFGEEGKLEFDRAAELAPETYIGYLARVQKNLYEDNLLAADKLLHEAVQSGQRDYRMLSLLGTVLLHEGAAPGEPRFEEARKALEQSAQENASYSATQIALGKVYLMENQPQNAIDHLEIGRRLEPDNSSVYASLASAYDRLGNHVQARQMRLRMGRLLAEKSGGANATQEP
ncbi:MAG TPA: tetratricopeptide repeat protein [Acidobacteriaceae bacterium]|nr:tetratricopeptide repeat protein [Acidobacteriaceae bacterium]